MLPLKKVLVGWVSNPSYYINHYSYGNHSSAIRKLNLTKRWLPIPLPEFPE